MVARRRFEAEAVLEDLLADLPLETALGPLEPAAGPGAGQHAAEYQQAEHVGEVVVASQPRRALEIPGDVPTVGDESGENAVLLAEEDIP